MVSVENPSLSPEMVRLTLPAAEQRDPSPRSPAALRIRNLFNFCRCEGCARVFPLWSDLAFFQISEEGIARARWAICNPQAQF